MPQKECWASKGGFETKLWEGKVVGPVGSLGNASAHTETRHRALLGTTFRDFDRKRVSDGGEFIALK